MSPNALCLGAYLRYMVSNVQQALGPGPDDQTQACWSIQAGNHSLRITKSAMLLIYDISRYTMKWLTICCLVGLIETSLTQGLMSRAFHLQFILATKK